MRPSIPVSLLSLAVLFSCTYDSISPADNTPNIRTLSPAEIEVADRSNDFAFDLFRSLQGETAGNLFISPLSVGTALGMTLNGASGETLEGILNTIQFHDMEPAEVNQAYKDLTALLTGIDRKVNLGLANSVWYRNSLTVKSSFAPVIEDYYDGKVTGLNFALADSKDIINGWVSDRTGGRIRELIDVIPPDAVMYLVNTIYFKGDWRYQFDKSRTKDDDFFLNDGTQVKLKMMVRPHSDHLIFRNDKFVLVDLPYGNGQFTMTILLPHAEYNTADIANEISMELLNEWLDRMDTSSFELQMPRFKMAWKKELNEGLSSMGMASAFSSGATFPNLFEEDLNLMISKVVHASFVEVNEVGTEAAAATVVEMVPVSYPPPAPPVLKINRPFIFLIRERHSGVILFMGQFTQPEPV